MGELADVLEVYYDDPVAFLEDMLDMSCDDWQGELPLTWRNMPKSQSNPVRA